MGAASGFVSSVLTYPFDLLRTVLMGSIETNKKEGIISSLNKIY